MDDNRILKGFHDPDYYPTICPVCAKVIMNDNAVAQNKGILRHLRRCLSGRIYKVELGGVINVLPEDMENEVAPTTIDTIILEPKNRWFRLCETSKNKKRK